MNYHIFVIICTLIYYFVLQSFKRQNKEDNDNEKSNSNLIYLLFVPLVLYLSKWLFMDSNIKDLKSNPIKEKGIVERDLDSIISKTGTQTNAQINKPVTNQPMTPKTVFNQTRETSGPMSIMLNTPKVNTPKVTGGFFDFLQAEVPSENPKSKVKSDSIKSKSNIIKKEPFPLSVSNISD